jgi:UDP-N-acetyl-D-galactosamine dehydrogenase
MKKERRIAILGLGYVGLPLAVEFGKYLPVIGFDINKKRVDELSCFIDQTNEVSSKEIQKSKISFSSDISDISESDFYIITVPTPVNKSKIPDLKPLISASKSVGSILKKGDIVVYESTVYPGATEEVCIPVLEKSSGLEFLKDFHVGYSPERINPGDKKHRVHNIKKIVAGSSKSTLSVVNSVYKKIVKAGTHQASSIKVAEAAKVIENTQRDLNIAFINELSILFDKLDIDTEAVLKAAETKWNFISFRPGMVGGHCIGVDPYYLTHKAKEVGYEPKIILAGRELNDKMPNYIGKNFLKALRKNSNLKRKVRILVLGITFKENCPDIRNSKVFDLIKVLKSTTVEVDAFDPYIKSLKGTEYKDIRITNSLKKNYYDGILIAVPHNEFKAMGINEIKTYGKKHCLVYDVKYLFDQADTDLRL